MNNIQLVLPSLKVSGGVAETLELATDLKTLGAQVGIVAMWSDSDPMPYQSTDLHHLSDWTARAHFALFQLPVLAIRFLCWVKACKLRRVDWIFTHYSTLPLALLVPRQHRWFFVQGLEWKFHNNKLVTKLLRKIITWGYRRSHLVAANSYLAKALQEERLAVRATAPIWASPCFDQPGALARDIDVLMMLRKGGCKRLDLYLQAIEWFSTQAPSLRVAVITTEDEIGSLVSSKVAEFHVRPGGQNAMRAIYRRSRLFLHLSEHEGFALPPLEAMGSGCVPICRNSGGPQAYMNSPLDSMLRPLSEPVDAVCRMAVELLDDQPRWQNLSNAARHAFQQGLEHKQQRARILEPLFPS